MLANRINIDKLIFGLMEKLKMIRKIPIKNSNFVYLSDKFMHSISFG